MSLSNSASQTYDKLMNNSNFGRLQRYHIIACCNVNRNPGCVFYYYWDRPSATKTSEIGVITYTQSHLTDPWQAAYEIRWNGESCMFLCSVLSTLIAQKHKKSLISWFHTSVGQLTRAIDDV